MVTTSAPKITLRDLIIRFTSRPNLSGKTRDFYSMVLRNFEWYARTKGWPGPEAITRDHIRGFLDYVANEVYRWPAAQRSSCKKAAPATLHHYGRVVKCLFNWAESEEYLENNPSLRIRLGSPRYKEVEPYSDDEVRAILGVCDEDARFRYIYLGVRNKAVISLFIATGLRLEELSRIKLSDIDSHLQELRVLGKGNKFRIVPIDGEARKALKHYLQMRPPGGDELWKTDDGQPLCVSSVKILIVRLKRRAGVTSGGGAHRFRHYFATRYLEAGGDINSLRLLLGHSTLDMVLKYSRFIDARRALEGHYQYNPLDRLYNGTGRKGNGGNRGRAGGDWNWKD